MTLQSRSRYNLETHGATEAKHTRHPVGTAQNGPRVLEKVITNSDISVGPWEKSAPVTIRQTLIDYNCPVNLADGSLMD